MAPWCMSDQRGDTEPSPAQRWFRLAEEDLIAARVLLRDGSAALRIAGFLAQQAAEKALKAGLFAANTAVPKIHGLSQLHASYPPADTQTSTMTISTFSTHGSSMVATQPTSPISARSRRTSSWPQRNESSTRSATCCADLPAPTAARKRWRPPRRAASSRERMTRFELATLT